MLFFSSFSLLLCALALGSFVNVLVYRLPKNISIISARSFCPVCKTQIKWYENIPLFSYVFLQAKCSYCKSPISFQYFLYELLFVCLSFPFILAFYMTNLKDYIKTEVISFSFLEYLILIVFVSLLFAIFIIDFQHKIIPIQITYSGILISIFYLFMKFSLEGLLDGTFRFGLIFFVLDSFLHFSNRIIFKNNYKFEFPAFHNLKIPFLEKRLTWIFLVFYCLISYLLLQNQFTSLKIFFQLFAAFYFFCDLSPAFFQKFMKSKSETLENSNPTILGGGDIVFLSWIALFSDLLNFFLVVFLASILALIYFLYKKFFSTSSSKELPFGPFLALAFLADMIRTTLVSY
jgi:prepilin signal peptidase PulO-like enzyme (type II secretory pathway)